MRVDYTLPSLQPGIAPELSSGPEQRPPFHEQLRIPTVQVPVGWEQQLRLNERPFTGTYIGPPPRPHTLQLSDPETERSRWRRMIWRHSRAFNAGKNFSPAAGTQSVHTMLQMLLQMQDLEDSIASRQVSLTRG